MWTSLLVLATALLLAECYQSYEPIYPPPHTTTIECKVPGPYENGKKRFVSDPMRTVIDEPRLRLSLIPGQNPEDCWQLPPIEVKEPYLPDDPDELQSLYALLDAFLNPSNQERLITTNVEGTLVAMDPNVVFNISRTQYQVPESYLVGFSPADQVTIMTYAAAIELGQCDLISEVKERPDNYYPRFQVHGRCDGRECALPPTEDHEFSQRCRSEVGGEDQIYIEALRWDCCHSYTIEQTYEYICGWRKVEVPVVHKCVCSCDPSEG